MNDWESLWRKRPAPLQKKLMTDMDTWGKKFYNDTLTYFHYSSTHQFLDMVRMYGDKIVAENSQLKRDNRTVLDTVDKAYIEELEVRIVALNDELEKKNSYPDTARVEKVKAVIETMTYGDAVEEYWEYQFKEAIK